MLGVLIGGLFTFSFAALLLVVFFGARRIEEEFKEKEAEVGAIRAAAAHIPRFIVVSPPAGARSGPFDEAVFGQVRRYLEAEQLLADEFVLRPSLESLYRESGRRPVGH